MFLCFVLLCLYRFPTHKLVGFGLDPSHNAPMSSPIDWMKTFYGAFGAKQPTASLVVVMILGALAAGTVWQLSGYLYNRDKVAEQKPISTGSAQTSGDCSAANTGSGNTINTDCSQNIPTKQPNSK